MCIFGDSITWGAYDPEGGGWATRLRNYFEGSGNDVQVYNLGISAATTADTLERFDVEAKARRPDSIVFALGINDSAWVVSKKARWVEYDEFVSNLGALYEKTRALGAMGVFVGLTELDETKTMPAPWHPDFSYDSASRKKYNDAIQEFCGKKNIPFISMDGVLTPDDLSDGLHPNSTGHRKMFERVKQEFAVILSLHAK